MLVLPHQSSGWQAHNYIKIANILLNSIKLASLLLVLLLVLAGCAVAPVQEMSDARQAVEVALEIGAGSLAPTEMRSAEDLLQQAEESLAQKQYGQARKQAQSAREQALIAQKKSLSQ